MADEDFVVERVVSKRTNRGSSECLVKWQDYDESENTWEKEKDLRYDDFGPLIDAYERAKGKNKKKKGRSKSPASSSSSSRGSSSTTESAPPTAEVSTTTDKHVLQDAVVATLVAASTASTLASFAMSSARLSAPTTELLETVVVVLTPVPAIVALYGALHVSPSSYANRLAATFLWLACLDLGSHQVHALRDFVYFCTFMSSFMLVLSLYADDAHTTVFGGMVGFGGAVAFVARSLEPMLSLSTVTYAEWAMLLLWSSAASRAISRVLVAENKKNVLFDLVGTLLLVVVFAEAIFPRSVYPTSHVLPASSMIGSVGGVSFDDFDVVSSGFLTLLVKYAAIGALGVACRDRAA